MWKRCLAFCRYRCRADTLWSFIQGYLLYTKTRTQTTLCFLNLHSHIIHFVGSFQTSDFFFLSCGPSDRDSHVISICFETIFTWSFLNRWCGFLHSLTVHWTGKCANNLHKFKYCSAKKWQHLNLNRLNIKKSYHHVVCFVFPFFSLAGYVWTSTNIWIFGKDSSFWLKYITHQIKPLHPEKTTRD